MIKTRFKVEKTSGRSGYWAVVDKASGRRVREYLPGRDDAREWCKSFNSGELDFILKEKGLLA